MSALYLGATVLLKDGRTVKCIEHQNIGEGWMALEVGAEAKGCVSVREEDVAPVNETTKGRP